VAGSDVVGGLILRLTAALRRVGVPVSTGEAVDAALALQTIDMEQVGLVRGALRATLVKRREDIEAFDRAFDALAPRVGGGPRASTPMDNPSPVAREGSETRPENGRESDPASAELLERLLSALQTDDDQALRGLATDAVDQFGTPAGVLRDSERALLYRVLRAIDLARILQRALRNQATGEAESELARALRVADLTARIDDLRRYLTLEVQRRFDVLDRRDTNAGQLIDPAELTIVGASRTELAAMRRALRPLARRLAARGARRNRRTRRGRLDVRRTIRASLSSGGVPLLPAWRRPRTTRPELVLLCDVSGSVAEFAGFTLALMSAMSAEFAAVRSFAFVDGVDEITRIVAEAGGSLLPTHVLARTGVVWRDGHSDYGRVLDQFAARFGDALTPRATLVITGDARTNYRVPNAAALASIRRSVRTIYWLNPESRDLWDTGDSLMGLYARSCTSVHEVRTLLQLEAAAEQIVGTSRLA
jgi:uncharacterized protein with von Willebrand factor type A (vWA) domain